MNSPAPPACRGLGQWWPPVAVWLLVVATTAATAFVLGQPPWRPDTYIRWDSGQYLAIAESGYYLHRCAESEPDYPPDAWCGNTGWLPGYPTLIRGLAATGLASLPLAGVILTHLAWLGLLVLLHRLLAAAPAPDRWWALVVAGFFPGSIYYQAVFPVAMALLAIVGMVWAVGAGRDRIAALCGALAACTYSTAFLLAAAALALLVLGERTPWRCTWPMRRIAWLLGGPLAGFALVLLYHHLALGQWRAFFLVQEHYGHGLHLPVATLWHHVQQLLHGVRPDRPAHLQSLAIAAGMVALLAWAARAWWRGELSLTERFVLLLAAAFWLFPLLMGPKVSLTRQESLLLPLVLLAPRLPLAARPPLLAALVVAKVLTALLFFASAII